MKNKETKVLKLITNNDKKNSDDDANNPDIVLKNSIGEYEGILILGYKHDGSLDVRASLNLNHENILFLIERFKHKLLNGDYFEQN